MLGAHRLPTTAPNVANVMKDAELRGPSGLLSNGGPGSGEFKSPHASGEEEDGQARSLHVEQRLEQG
jgi:hypothetical protein